MNGQEILRVAGSARRICCPFGKDPSPGPPPASDEDPRLALTALRELVDNDLPWVERTVVRNARSQGYDWGRIGRLLHRSRQAVHKRYSHLDGTYEPIRFDPLTPDDKLTSDINRSLADKRRWIEFEESAPGDVVAW